MGKYLDGGGLDTLWGRIGQKVGTKADKVLKATVTRSGSSPNYTYSLNKTMTEIVNALGTSEGNTTVVLWYDNVAYWFYKTSVESSTNNTRLHFTAVNSDASSVSTSEFILVPNTSSVTFGETTLTPVTDISGKQDTLVSGTNIKTIDSNSLLGSGNIVVFPKITNEVSLNSTTTEGVYRYEISNPLTSEEYRSIIIVSSTYDSRVGTTVTQTEISKNSYRIRTKVGSGSWSSWADVIDISGKANDNAVVHLDGDETIEDNKTFTGSIVIDSDTGAMLEGTTSDFDWISNGTDTLQDVLDTKFNGVEIISSNAIVSSIPGYISFSSSGGTNPYSSIKTAYDNNKLPIVYLSSYYVFVALFTNDNGTSFKGHAARSTASGSSSYYHRIFTIEAGESSSTLSISDGYQKPSGGIPASDLASGVIPDVSGKADKARIINIVKSGTSPNYTYSLPSGTTASSIATDLTNGTMVFCVLDNEVYFYDRTTGSSSSTMLYFKHTDTTSDGVVEKEFAIAYSNNAVTLTTTTADVYNKVSKVTSTDNAIVRFDGTGGQIQNSGVTIDDNGKIETADDIKCRKLIIQGSNTTNETRYWSSDAASNMWATIGTTTALVIKDTEVRRGSSATSVNLGTAANPWNGIYGKNLYVCGSASNNSSTYWTTGSSSQMYAKIGSATPFLIEAASIRCGTTATGTIDLGRSDATWKDLYLTGSIKDGTNTKSLANIVAGLLPDVTSSDNGKILKVASGAWSVEAASGGGGVQSISCSENDILVSTTTTNTTSTAIWTALQAGKMPLLYSGTSGFSIVIQDMGGGYWSGNGVDATNKKSYNVYGYQGSIVSGVATLMAAASDVKAPLIIAVPDENDTLTSGTYASITTALAAGREVLLKATMATEDDQYIYLHLLSDETVNDNGYYFYAQRGKYNWTACIMDDESITYSTTRLATYSELTTMVGDIETLLAAI